MPGEHAFLLRQPAGHDQRIVRGDQDLAVEDGRVEHGRDEPLVEAAQALHAIAGVRLGGDHLNAGLVFFESSADARERAAGAEPGDEVGDLRAGRAGSRAPSSRSARRGSPALPYWYGM